MNRVADAWDEEEQAEEHIAGVGHFSLSSPRLLTRDRKGRSRPLLGEARKGERHHPRLNQAYPDLRG